MGTSQTAVLLFSRTAAEEAVEKNLISHFDRIDSIKLTQHLINYTNTQAAKSGLPVYTCFSDQQRGSNFGERLANAIEDIFLKGFEKLIVIGSDSPSITSSLIKRTNNHLQCHELVLAPATDGGVYLIGLTRDAYSRDKFLNVPWLSANVFTALKYYAASLSISMLKEVGGQDIDNLASLQIWLKLSSTHILHPHLCKIFQTLKDIQQCDFLICSSQYFHHNTTSLRGPPLPAKSFA